MTEVRVCSPLSIDCLEDLVTVINSAFNSFRSAGMTPERMRLIAEEDDGVGEGRAYIAYVGGEPASAVQVVVRNLTLRDGEVLKVAGIANVGTAPRFRGRGLAKLLLNYVLSHVKEKLNLSVATLFAGSGSVAHRIYLKLGFRELWKPVKLLCDEGCLRTLLTLERSDELISWHPPMSPEPLGRLYEGFSTALTYVVRRPSKYWGRIIRRNPHYTWFHSNPEDLEVCELRSGEVVAYYALTTWRESDLRGVKSGGSAYLKELLCVDEVSCAHALRRIAERALSKGLTDITIDLPENHPVLDTLKRAGARWAESDEVFMVKYLEAGATPEEHGKHDVIHISTIDRW